MIKNQNARKGKIVTESRLVAVLGQGGQIGNQVQKG